MFRYILFFVISATFYPLSAVSSDHDGVERLMTFFTTTTERNKLDEMRTTGGFDKNTELKSDASFFKGSPNKIELKGLMIRGKGKPVVWVNKESTIKSNKIDPQISVQIKSINKEKLKVPINFSQKKLILKPGQQWNETNSKVNDSFQMK